MSEKEVIELDGIADRLEEIATELADPDGDPGLLAELAKEAGELSTRAGAVLSEALRSSGSGGRSFGAGG